ncbi:retron-type reverse transcriptase [Flavobacterium sp. 7E]|uniref:reverse transcriptase family protein n=1 Tax=Flavobacterium sp. 7E TaxID=2735898 RepID=UPI00156F3516|nr:reverse transcriptase family protein [Flavobacterium sp. 7E]NRS87785.1 retron-type reverse transcriptase [Flavobacterium sp. 7E]
MKLALEQINNLKTAFEKMDSKEDFLALLNLAKSFLYGENTVVFEMKQLNYYINKDQKTTNKKVNLEGLLNTGDDRFKTAVRKPAYTSFSIKKKSREDRILHAPVKGLKEFQKALNLIFQCVYEPHKAATGFVLGKSIVDNAKLHVNQNYVYNLDLKDFFPSIDQARVWGRIKAAPFNLETTVERQKIANMIAALCCTPMEVERNTNGEWKKITLPVLPQGAPTSPTLTNAICERLDLRLAGVAKRFGLNYSRYADDITFSSKHNSFEKTKNVFENIYLKDSTFDKEVRKIIASQNFHIKESKVRLQKQGYRQEVTGIVVNDKVNINQKYIKQLRQWLFYWETFGYDRAYQYFLQKYVANKGHVKKGQPNMAMVLDGKLLYLKMVKGETDPAYLKLRERFEKLIGSKSNISEILDLWETKGIDEAMKAFYFAKQQDVLPKVSTRLNVEDIFYL